MQTGKVLWYNLVKGWCEVPVFLKKTDRLKKNLGMVLFLLFILWTGVIFYFSSQPSGVSNHQSKTAVKIISAVNDVFDITDTKVYIKLESMVKDIPLFDRFKTPNAVVRKSAHFGIYFLLGIIASGFSYIYSRKILIGFLLGTSLPVMVAVLDEFNQGFVGRNSSLQDVMIDGAGAFIGTLGMIFLIALIKIIKLARHYLT